MAEDEQETEITLAPPAFTHPKPVQKNLFQKKKNCAEQDATRLPRPSSLATHEMLWFTKHAKVVGVTRAPSTSQDGGGARKEHAGNGDGRGVGAVVVDVGPDQHQALQHAERKVRAPTARHWSVWVRYSLL